jgi:hypothetical protein
LHHGGSLNPSRFWRPLPRARALCFGSRQVSVLSVLPPCLDPVLSDVCIFYFFLGDWRFLRHGKYWPLTDFALLAAVFVEMSCLRRFCADDACECTLCPLLNQWCVSTWVRFQHSDHIPSVSVLCSHDKSSKRVESTVCVCMRVSLQIRMTGFNLESCPLIRA